MNNFQNPIKHKLLGSLHHDKLIPVQPYTKSLRLELNDAVQTQLNFYLNNQLYSKLHSKIDELVFNGIEKNIYNELKYPTPK